MRSVATVWVLVLVVGIARVSAAANYHVDPAGNDANDGLSPATPFLTPQRALDLAQPGDVVILAPGDYLRDVMTRRDGTAASPITVRGPATAVIRGAGGNSNRIFTIHHSHITVEGITVDGSHGAGYRNKGIWVQGTTPLRGPVGVRLLGLTVRNVLGECVRFRYFVQHSEVAGSTIGPCGLGDSTGHNAERVYLGTHTAGWGDGKNPTADPDDTSFNWIHHNVMLYKGSECVDLKEGTRQNLVEHNDCQGNADSETGIIESRGNDNLIRYNTLHGVGGNSIGYGVKLRGDYKPYGQGNVVHDNAIRDSARQGIYIASGYVQGEICDNTMSGNGGLINLTGIDPTAPCLLAGKCTDAAGCDDGNPCTSDACDAALGCLHTPNTSSCDDGDACTSGDACAAGTCAGVPLVCSDGDACNGTERCDPIGACVLGAPPACDDGDACNGAETCSPTAGCQAGVALDCDDGDPCTADACTAGGCENSPVADGASCGDGDACNGVETCQAGACVAAAAPTCDDGDACTRDACEPATGCVHEEICTATVVASDGFEGGFTGGAGWAEPRWRVAGDAAINGEGTHSGTRHAKLRNGTGSLKRTVNLAGRSGARLRLWSKVSSFESNDRASIKVTRTPGRGYTTALTVTSSAPDRAYVFHDVDLGVCDGSATCEVFVDAEMNASSDTWYIDDLELVVL